MKVTLLNDLYYCYGKFIYLWCCTIVLLCSAFIPTFAWSDDRFLLQLETDAKRQATALIAPTLSTDPRQLDLSEKLPLGLQQTELETILREQAISTWAFYERLTPPQRQHIFEAYRRDGRLSTLREQTLRLLAGE